MPRSARVTLPAVTHHVTQRGNNGQDVFFTDEDRRLYLDLLTFYAKKRNLSLLGYCLMTNHVHLVVVPTGAEDLSLAIGRVHWRYSQEINRLHGRSGHLWQGRFYSCAMDEPHAYRALAYVERNPVRAGMVRRAWEYPWSSARFHVGMEAAPSWLDMGSWQKWTDASHWRRELAREGVEGKEGEPLRYHTRRGRPLGSDEFLARMEARIGRRLRRLPVGRPPKK